MSICVKFTDSIEGFLKAKLGPFVVFLALGIAIVFPVALIAQTEASPKSKPFVVSVSEAKVDNQHGVSSSDCVMVLPDGRFHLERRRQVSPKPEATLSIYESSLDSLQFEHLQHIVGEQDMGKLPAYAEPSVSVDAAQFEEVTVKFNTQNGIRGAGYWITYGRRPGAAPIPNDVQKRWQDSQTALQPLVDWLHELQTLKLAPSDVSSTQCLPEQP